MLTLVLVCILSLCFTNVIFGFAPSQGYWTSKASIPYPNGCYSAQAAVIDGKIYLAARTGITTAQMEIYDPSSDSWAVEASVTIPKDYYCAASVGLEGKIYVFSPSYALNTFGVTWVYDPSNDSWQSKAEVPALRDGTQAICIDERIYLISGGYQSVGNSFFIAYPYSNWVYDPFADSWSQMAPIPTGVAHYASAVLGNKIYIIGGLINPGGPYNWRSTGYTNLVQIFDPATNQWNQGAPMPTARAYMSASVCVENESGAERIYVVGGSVKNGTAYSAVNWTQIYDPQTNTWSNGPSMPTARYGLSLANVNNKLYGISGMDVSNSSWLTTNEEYSPSGFAPVQVQSPLPSDPVPVTPSPKTLRHLSTPFPVASSPTPSPSVPPWTPLPTDVPQTPALADAPPLSSPVVSSSASPSIPSFPTETVALTLTVIVVASALLLTLKKRLK